MDSTGSSLGLPHSEVSGSMLATSSPECFVGRHVLLRLCAPRYPPSALICLTALISVLSACFDCLLFDVLLCSFQGASLETIPAGCCLILTGSCWILFPVFGFLTLLSGGKRTRTADICLAKAALYQLSYTPTFSIQKSKFKSQNYLVFDF